MKVGFIGLGMMGKPMSKRVLAAGYPLTVHHMRPQPMEKLVREGAKKAQTPKEVAQVSDIVLTSLPTLKAWEEVYRGVNGLLLVRVRQSQDSLTLNERTQLNTHRR